MTSASSSSRVWAKNSQLRAMADSSISMNLCSSLSSRCLTTAMQEATDTHTLDALRCSWGQIFTLKERMCVWAPRSVRWSVHTRVHFHRCVAPGHLPCITASTLLQRTPPEQPGRQLQKGDPWSCGFLHPCQGHLPVLCASFQFSPMMIQGLCEFVKA